MMDYLKIGGSFVSAALCAAVLMGQANAAEGVGVDVDWRAFLDRHDLVMERPAKYDFEAPFVGNGRSDAQQLVSYRPSGASAQRNHVVASLGGVRACGGRSVG